jgi:hypothetical protein
MAFCFCSIGYFDESCKNRNEIDPEAISCPFVLFVLPYSQFAKETEFDELP